jgi:hypothetical protein
MIRNRMDYSLQLFYNTSIKNGHAPNYLRELIPPTVQSTTIYPLRNGSDLIIPFCKLSQEQAASFTILTFDRP